MITPNQLQQIYPQATQANVNKYFPYLYAFMMVYFINNRNRVCMFLAQIGHESAQLRYAEENLNYSAAALRRVFGKYFPTAELANRYARNPERIANRVYANRIGNGNEASGDGWKFRGRGLIQITGRANYQQLEDAWQVALIANPLLLATAEYAAKSACWWWNSRKLNEIANKGTTDAFKQVTRIINGGYNGLDDRLQLWNNAKKVIK